jgi:hypothetical protein
MRHGLPILALLALLPLRPAAADWEYTKWGMTPAQVVNAAKGAVLETKATSAGEGSGFEMRASGEFVAGSLRFEVGFGFDGAGRLGFVTYTTRNPAQNGAFKDWLIRKYGVPQSGKTSEDGDVETWTWNRPGLDSIELEIPEGDPAFVIQSPAGK